VAGDRDTMVQLDQSLLPPFSRVEGEGSGESPPRIVPFMRYHLHLPILAYRVSMYRDISLHRREDISVIEA
jgi:hypothetical protein